MKIVVVSSFKVLLYLQEFLPQLQPCQVVERVAGLVDWLEHDGEPRDVVFLQRVDVEALASAWPACGAQVRTLSVYNTEQMTCGPFKTALVDTLLRLTERIPLRPLHVVDYSDANAQLLQEALASRNAAPGAVYQLHVLPLATPAAEEARLRALLATARKQYHFAHVGGVTPRRQALIEQLQARGLSVRVVTSFGRQRDEEVASCMALLNVHYDDHRRIFETSRCTRWLQAGMLTLSESSLDAPAHALLHCAPYAQLADAAARLTPAAVRAPPALQSE